MLVVAFLMGSLSVLFQVSYSPLWFLWLLPSPILGLRTLPEAELDDAA